MPSPGSLLHASIPRPRLAQRIDAPDLAPVTLIIAPAGYGKSTLAAQWAVATSRRVAGVPLGPDANNVATFLNRLATAIDCALDTGAHVPDPELTLDAIVDRLAAATAEPGLAIVLDDYHLVENRDVHQAMEALIATLPPHVRLVIASRTQPPLALGRLRAYGQVRELAAADLAFTREETAAVIPHTLTPRLTPDQVDRLADRTEGWIAGIRLALGSLDRTRGVEFDDVIDTLAANAWLDDYLVEEVLDRLSPALREFVLRSAHLPWLGVELCDHALELETSARLLQQVRRRIVFVRSGPEPDTLVYHALFAECVQRIAARTVPVGERQAMYRRTSDWLARNQHLELALTYAVTAEAWDDAREYARILCQDALHYALHHSRLHWLRQLPERLVLDDPFLARSYITALQLTGLVREARQAFAVVEAGWRTSGDPVQLGHACACRTDFAIADGEIDLALHYCYEALHHYPPDQVIERMFAWGGVLGIEFLRGNDLVSNLAYRQVARCRERLPAGQGLWTLMYEPDRALRQSLRGNLPAAEGLLRSVVTTLPAQYRRVYEARLRTRLAAISLEWNDLERAVAEVAHIERDLETIPHHAQHPECMLMIARVAAAVGDGHKVEATLRQVRELGEANGNRSFLVRLESVQAMAWLEAGNLDLAREWAATTRLEDCPPPVNVGEPDPRLALVRIDLAAGNHARAHARLRDLIADAVAGKRWAELVPLAVWQVVACLALDDEAAALVALALALKHGRTGRFVRSFLTSGYDLRPFLSRALPHLERDEGAWLGHLLGQGIWPPAEEDEPAAGDPVLAHPLSRRELEVLDLIASGLANRAIGERLFISERTVKRHVGSILAKLQAGNRAEAVERARAYGIIASDPVP